VNCVKISQAAHQSLLILRPTRCAALLRKLVGASGCMRGADRRMFSQQVTQAISTQRFLPKGRAIYNEASVCAGQPQTCMQNLSASWTGAAHIKHREFVMDSWRVWQVRAELLPLLIVKLVPRARPPLGSSSAPASRSGETFQPPSNSGRTPARCHYIAPAYAPP
jgi:hypothetical protein